MYYVIFKSWVEKMVIKISSVFSSLLREKLSVPMSFNFVCKKIDTLTIFLTNGTFVSP